MVSKKDTAKRKSFWNHTTILYTVAAAVIVLAGGTLLYTNRSGAYDLHGLNKPSDYDFYIAGSQQLSTTTNADGTTITPGAQKYIQVAAKWPVNTRGSLGIFNKHFRYLPAFQSSADYIAYMDSSHSVFTASVLRDYTLVDDSTLHFSANNLFFGNYKTFCTVKKPGVTIAPSSTNSAYDKNTYPVISGVDEAYVVACSEGGGIFSITLPVTTTTVVWPTRNSNVSPTEKPVATPVTTATPVPTTTPVVTTTPSATVSNLSDQTKNQMYAWAKAKDELGLAMGAAIKDANDVDATITLGGKTITIDSISSITAGGKTITPASPSLATGGGQTSAIAINGIASAIVGGNTSGSITSPTISTNSANMTVGGQTIPINSISSIIAGGQVINPNTGSDNASITLGRQTAKDVFNGFYQTMIDKYPTHPWEGASAPDSISTPTVVSIPATDPTTVTQASNLSSSEKSAINAWLTTNALDSNGNSINSIAQIIERVRNLFGIRINFNPDYQTILNNNPTHPWNTTSTTGASSNDATGVHATGNTLNAAKEAVKAGRK